MAEEYKQREAVLKFYLPDNEVDFYLASHASDMYAVLYNIDQFCRGIEKHGNEKIKDQYDLADKIREMIHENVDMNKIP